MAYRADIEIAVKGAQELKRLSDQISATSKLVDGLNKYLENIGTGGVVRNINNLNSAVYEAAAAFNKVALGTEEATIAARAYDQATRAANAGIEEKLRLLQAVREEERKSRLTAAGISERTPYGGQIGPGEASSVLSGQSAPVDERIRRTLQARRDETQLQQALLQLEQKSASELNRKLQSQEALVQGTKEVLELLDQQVKKQEFLAGKTTGSMQGPLAGPGAMGFPVALPLSKAEQKGLEIEYQKQQIVQRTLKTKQELQGLALNLQRLDQNSAVAIADAERNQRRLNAAKERELQISKQGALIAGRFSPIGGAENIPGSPAAIAAANRRNREATSNAIIGGAFPLLFGQGVGAAVGGGIGGFTGGMAGGQLGFGLSLVGTAVGASFDALIQSSTEFAKSLRQGGDAATYLENTLGYLDPTIKKQIQNLQNSGQTAAAAELAFQELSRTVGKSGAEAFLELGKQTEAGTLSIKKLTASFIAAGLAYNKFFSDIQYGKGKDFTTFLPQQFRPTSTPQAETETALFRQRTAELSKNNDILRLQVQLTSTSAKNDLDRFLTIQKQIAIKEYENELTKISIQLKNKEISIDQNKLLITTANLELSKKFGDIERTRIEEIARRQREAAQAAEQAQRNAIADKQDQLNIEKALIDEQLKLIDINIQEQTFLGGESAGLTRSIALFDNKVRLVEKILNNEKETALLQVRTSQQARQTNLLFERKRENLQFQLNLEKDILIEKQKQQQLDKFKQTQTAIKSAIQPFQDLKANKELEIQYTKTYQRLVQEGLLPVEAERIANFEKLVAQQKASVETEILLTQALLTRAQAMGANTTELENQLNILNQMKTAIEGQAAAGPGQVRNAPGSTLTARMTELQGSVNELTNLENVGVKAADNIGQAFGTAFQDIVTGASTGQEALANMMNSIGQNFINMAAQIIAQQTTMIILGSILKALGISTSIGGGGSTGGLGSLESNLNQYAPIPDTFGATATFRADGGSVSAGQPYTVGERGPELFVPSSSGGVLSNSDLRQTMAGGASGSSSPVLNMSFETTSIGGVEYVSRDQLELAMAETRRQAAKDGARRGMTMTLDKLQQSPQTRSRIGLR